MYNSHLHVWCIYVDHFYHLNINVSEPSTVHESGTDAGGMEIQESDVQEVLGGWTEVEMNAPRDFQHKVQ